DVTATINCRSQSTDGRHPHPVPGGMDLLWAPHRVAAGDCVESAGGRDQFVQRGGVLAFLPARAGGRPHALTVKAMTDPHYARPQPWVVDAGRRPYGMTEDTRRSGALRATESIEPSQIAPR